MSVVTEDWRYRMVTPPKGDYASVPLNDEGRKVVDAWDPAKDTAAGNACKAYGAAKIMRVPGRVRITWQDDTTLKIETDAGQQTRLLRFGESRARRRAGWQGYSAAEWEVAADRPAAAEAAVAASSRRAAADRDAAGGGAAALGCCGAGRGAPRGSAAARRIAEGRHDAPQGRISAKERRALQRGHHAD